MGNQTKEKRCLNCGRNVEKPCIDDQEIEECPFSRMNPLTPSGKRTVMVVLDGEIGFVPMEDKTKDKKLVA